MILNFKKLHPLAKPPMRATDGAAGWDLTCASYEYDSEHGVYSYDTGLAIEIPVGYVGLLLPRSSVYRVSCQLANSCGVLDSDYRGPVTLKFRAWSGYPYGTGDRIGQLLVVPIADVTGFNECDILSETRRGTGGYGSTGR